jgi:hypothetical protein
MNKDKQQSERNAIIVSFRSRESGNNFDKMIMRND